MLFLDVILNAIFGKTNLTLTKSTLNEKQNSSTIIGGCTNCI